MDIKIIEKALRDYKRKQSVVETTLARIESYKKARDNPDSYTHVFPDTTREVGMPGGTGVSSPVEIAVTNKEKASSILNEWIEDDHSRIYPYQIELEQLDGALSALNKQERLIIECKYFERMFWSELETVFNEKFRGKNYITTSGIRKMDRQALELMGKILKPYYNRFKITK